MRLMAGQAKHYLKKEKEFTIKNKNLFNYDQTLSIINKKSELNDATTFFGSAALLIKLLHFITDEHQHCYGH